MYILIRYSHTEQSIALDTDISHLYHDLLDELENMKNSFSYDFSIDMHVDESKQTLEGISHISETAFHLSYKTLDTTEICHCLHLILFMEDMTQHSQTTSSVDSGEENPIAFASQVSVSFEDWLANSDDKYDMELFDLLDDADHSDIFDDEDWLC